MKIKKNVLAEALKVLGRVVSQTSPEAVLRSVRFVGTGNRVWLSATDGIEVVAQEVDAESEGMVDFAVEYKVLRELVRGTRGREVEVVGEKMEWPEVAVPPAEAKQIPLPENFFQLLAEAAQIVNRQEARIPLRGIDLCSSEIVVTDGKQLLHLPVAWTLDAELTLPFPLALLTAKPEGVGTLVFWELKGVTVFQIEIGSFVWIGSPSTPAGSPAGFINQKSKDRNHGKREKRKLFPASAVQKETPCRNPDDRLPRRSSRHHQPVQTDKKIGMPSPSKLGGEVIFLRFRF